MFYFWHQTKRRKKPQSLLSSDRQLYNGRCEPKITTTQYADQLYGFLVTTGTWLLSRKISVERIHAF